MSSVDMDFPEINWGKYLIICILISLILIFLLVSYTGLIFCNSKGYDSVSKTYSDKFEKIECSSCYGDECAKEEFNVKRNFIFFKEKKE